MHHLLITGASGFVGRSVIDFLLTLPDSQRPEIVTLASRTKITNLSPLIDPTFKVNHVQTDLLDKWNFDRSVTHVLQLAADGSENAYSQKASDDFVVFSRRLIEWSENSSQKLVVMHASSGACFGYFPLAAGGAINRKLDNPSQEIWPKSVFIDGRLEAEHILQQGHENELFDLRIARLFSFIGVHIRDKTHYAVPSFISMAKTSGVIRLAGDPMTVRSYLSAHDMSNWIFSALRANSGLPLLSIGSSVAVTMIDLAEFVAAQFSAKVVINDQHTAGDVYVADNELTKNLLQVDETISWQQALLDL